jgi:hypothetical protein
MLKTRLMKVQIFLILAAVLVTSCGAGAAPEGTETPTLSANQIQTRAVATFSSAMTLTALVAPTETPAATDTPAPTFAALPTSTGGTPFSGSTPGVPVSGGGTTSCYALTFVKDVSIPDNTQMDPGESFTKTWQVLNSGSCAWEAGFKFQNTGGNAMEATALTLTSEVASGATFDLSVPMTAPTAAGTVRGNWRMSDANGQFFGDEVFVVIVVGNAAPAATNTTGAPAVTETSTTP